MKKSSMKFIAGAAVGASLGVLLAPKKGSETREDLKNKAKEVSQKIKNIKPKDVKKEFDKKMKKIERDIKKLDKEKVLAVAKVKIEKIKADTDKLVEMAKEKGNENLEKAANELRTKAIEITKMILEKLENAEKQAK